MPAVKPAGSGDLLPPSPPAEKATGKPATLARIMVGDPPFYCPVLGKTDGGENDRLGAGAYRGSRRRLRHSISAVGPETPHQEKTAARPLNLPCSSAHRPCALRARDTYQVSKMNSQGVLLLLPLLTAHSTWQHSQSFEDKERSPSREASS